MAKNRDFFGLPIFQQPKNSVDNIGYFSLIWQKIAIFLGCQFFGPKIRDFYF